MDFYLPSILYIYELYMYELLQSHFGHNREGTLNSLLRIYFTYLLKSRGPNA